MSEALTQAILDLLDEYRLEDFVDIVRDDAKAEAAEMGILSHEHPRVRRFQEICRTLRAAVTPDARRTQDGRA